MAQFTRDDVQTAIEGLFTSGWGATPLASVAFENIAFDSAAQAGPWVEVVIQRQGATTLTVGLYQTMTGIIWVTAYIPEGFGKQTATQLLDAASALLNGVRIAVGSTANMTISGATGEIPNTKTGWYGLQVGFRFSVI